ncbi:MAG: DsbA family oxidoreductase [Balneolaceae bacterium]
MNEDEPMNTLKSLNPDTKTETIQVDVWSDVVCPFCYIGKRNLENALEQSGLADSVEVVWRSFELAPDAETKPGASIYEELAARKGWSTEQSKQIHNQMVQMAKQSGLDFDFDQTIPANSFNAHRLLHLAKKHGVQNDTKERLLKAYFTDGKNIDDPDFLIATGKEAGLKETEIRSALESDDIEKEVTEDIQNARAMGIYGVPFFVLDQKYSVSGAQPVDVFVQALQKAKAEKTPEGLPADGDVCGPDGQC